jgi:serine/threonine protein kinase
MGNIVNKSLDEDEEIVVGKGHMHTNMLRMMHDNVFKKYKVIEVIGTGSMGFVAKARIRTKEIGGSALKKKGFLQRKNDANSLADRREDPVFYALKSIQVDRESSVFLEELRNEMDILRRLVRFAIQAASQDLSQVVLRFCGANLHSLCILSSFRTIQIL